MKSGIKWLVIIGMIILIAYSINSAENLALGRPWWHYIAFLAGILLFIGICIAIWRYATGSKSPEEEHEEHDDEEEEDEDDGHKKKDHHKKSEKKGFPWGTILSLVAGVVVAVGLYFVVTTLMDDPPANSPYSKCYDYTLVEKRRTRVKVNYRHFRGDGMGQPMYIWVNGQGKPKYDDGSEKEVKLGPNIEFLDIMPAGPLVNNGDYVICFFK